MIRWFINLFKPCDHTFVFDHVVQEQNLRGGYRHISRIYVCSKCGKREVREDATL